LLDRSASFRVEHPYAPGLKPSDEEEFIPTRDSLLSRLKDWRDDDGWRDFFNIWKLVYGVAAKAGLTDQEAQEVVQETVITVARRIPEFKYDPGVCSFKTWLLNLTRWRIVDQLRRRRPEPGGRARADASARTATIDRVVDPNTVNLDAVWDEQWERNLLEAAIARVKRRTNPEHYQMFHLCVFKDWAPSKVARELGVSTGRVYLAKHRIAAQLKREVKKLETQLS
jgi:RNA polymerase sigma-70 factor (ECF subfamily)